MSAKIFTIVLVSQFFIIGCDQQRTTSNSSIAKYINAYGPTAIDIVGLSELTSSSNNDVAKLKLFVKVLDTFGSAMKTPCVLRVELYDYIQHSSSQVGKRIEIWPDIDLTDICKNNAQWRDYLRTYEFDFDISSNLTIGHTYILEVTCLSPLVKRMTSQYKLIYKKQL
jgi:hypothetical protein